MVPQFTHDCSACKFITTVGKIDVYVCGTSISSIIARFSNEGSDYASMPIEIFTDMIKNNSGIRLHDGKIMQFRDYLASEHVVSYHKAWLIALPLID